MKQTPLKQNKGRRKLARLRNLQNAGALQPNKSSLNNLLGSAMTYKAMPRLDLSATFALPPFSGTLTTPIPQATPAVEKSAALTLTFGNSAVEVDLAGAFRATVEFIAEHPI